MGETKIIYHIDEEETPYLVKLPIPPDQVTLADFKNVLNRPSYKFFFKSMDDDFGVVKEEIVDDDAKLPCFNGRVISWLVSADGSSVSDSVSQCTDSLAPSEVRGGPENRPIQPFRPPGPHGRAIVDDFTTTETESVVSSRRSDRHILHRSVRQHREAYENYDRFDVGPALPRLNGHPHSHPHAHGIHAHGHLSGKQRSSSHGYESSSMLSSDLESTSFVDSEEDASSRITTTTERSSVSRAARHRRPRRRRPRMPPMSRTSSFSSITDSTMSLNIITVTLNMDSVNFLGISIVGQSHKGGDGGIYVGSIMKGGAVALDGRIEPGDMILQVNDINFENMSNDDAVRVLREVVQKPGPIKLVVAKCWDPHPKGYFTIPRTEPVRPIDPGAWVAHTEAARGLSGGLYPNRPPSVTTLTSSSSLISSLPESERPPEELNLTVHTDMGTIVRAMAQPDSGLEIRDRMWLKIVIPNAFIGADVVDWLHTHVQGFEERREARKYASQLLKAGFIRHTVNKITFSEQCYYVFGDLCGGMASMRLHDHDSVSEADRDMLCPLPPPAGSQTGGNGGPGWGGIHMPYAGTFQPSPASGYAPMPFSYSSDAVAGYAHPYGNGSNSVNSGSGSSNGSDGRGNIGLGIGLVERQPGSGLVGAINPIGPGVHGSTGSGSGSHSGSASTASSDGDSQRSERSRRTLTGPGQAGLGMGMSGAAGMGLPTNLRPLGQVPADVSGSRQSFRMAMTNPCEYFVDVM